MLASPDSPSIVRTFLDEMNVGMVTLMDDAGIYEGYDRRALGESLAPYPLHVVLDADHTVRHLSTDSDPRETVAALEGLLR